MTAGRRDQRLTRRDRIARRSDFLTAQERGRRVSGASYLVFAVPRPESARRARLGITVSKKVGNAVTRNRVKRWVRESCRRMAEVPAAMDIVVVARPAAATIGFENTASELRGLMRRLAKP